MPVLSERDKFWRWFRANGARVRAQVYGPDPAAREAATDELRTAIQAAEPVLTLEIGQGGEGGPDQLIASADGRLERVDAVKDFVAAAPAIPGWEVVAFRPRMEIGDQIEIVIQGERVGPSDVWFRVVPDELGLALTLYVRGLTDENRKVRGLGASLLAEHTMGELAALTLLSGLHTEPLPADPGAAGLRPLPELLAVIDEARQTRYPAPGALAFDRQDGWMNLTGSIKGSPALMLLHAGLAPLAGHPDYDRRLTVSLPFESDDDGMPVSREVFDAVCASGDEISDALEDGQQSLLALTVTTQGRRDLVLYTSDAPAALERLEPWLADEALDAVARVEWDTFWGMYRSFLDAANSSDKDEGEGAEEPE